MVRGDINRIDLGTAFFERIITGNCFYVDKSGFIEHFLNDANEVVLIARHRRLGKSLNMDMLRCFLTDRKDNRGLFRGLYIENRPVWERAHSAPVFAFNLKGMNETNYQLQLFLQVFTQFNDSFNKNSLSEEDLFKWDLYCGQKGADTNGLLLLTELAYHLTGKRSYLLVDEYDKPLRDTYQTGSYDAVFETVKLFFSAGLKDNPYLEKGLLTGVLRVSYEGMLSDLNNIATYDIFEDDVYTDDYGFTEEEMDEIQALVSFDREKLRQWYNGVRVNQKAIYNVYSVSSFLRNGKYACYWGKSQLLNMIAIMMNDDRKSAISEMMNGEQIEVPVDTRISLKELWESQDDYSFYSFLIQGGYLTIHEMFSEKSTATVSIPNEELMRVWKTFILKSFYPRQQKMLTMFDRADNLGLLALDIESFLSDSLSYYDLAVHTGEERHRVWERVYHVFILGILSAYTESSYSKPVSEGEGGDGRYDILYQRANSYYLFEFKSCDRADQLEARAGDALRQIDEKRYGARLNPSVPLIKVGIAISGKQCRVKCGR
ncbi:MAG: ATP-binding protein [Clostridiales bacterium]|jgi:hypothetical protein|nr:ATP-binding protein [Clostridiales bacterium]